MLVIAVLAILAVAAPSLIASSTAPAQEQPLDVGEQSLLIRACDYGRAAAAAEAVAVRWCRQNGAPEVAGNRALVRIRLNTSSGKFDATIQLERSLWSVDAAKIEVVG